MLLAVLAGLLLLAGFGLWFLVTQPFAGAVARPPVEVDPKRLAEHVRFLTTTVHPRSFEFPENLDAAAAYLQRELAGSGARTQEQPFDVGGATYRNVIGSFGPESGERIVVGAHYDAVEGTPGADDNASGVAVLLELARLLGTEAPRVRVDLVAFTLEEPPIFRTYDMGSARHARSLKEAGAAVRAMMSVECVGYYSILPRSQAYPLGLLSWFYPSRGDFVAVVGRFADAPLLRRVKAGMRGATDLPVHSLSAPALVPGVDFSDHLSYWAHGYPAVMVTDTAFYRNAHYHEATDTADTLDYRRLAQVVQGVHGAVRTLAD